MIIGLNNFWSELYRNDKQKITCTDRNGKKEKEKDRDSLRKKIKKKIREIDRYI